MDIHAVIAVIWSESLTCISPRYVIELVAPQLGSRGEGAIGRTSAPGIPYQVLVSPQCTVDRLVRGGWAATQSDLL